MCKECVVSVSSERTNIISSKKMVMSFVFFRFPLRTLFPVLPGACSLDQISMM